MNTILWDRVYIFSLIFDDLIDQAKELVMKGFKDPAAVLGRIIIETTLKDLCKKEKIEIEDKAGLSAINNQLKEAGVFTKPQFKNCQINIELGNSAAHGKFEDYDESDVKKMLEYLESSLLLM